MDPGTALAVASLSFQVFGGCVKAFTLLSNARNLGKDASMLQTMLNLEEYRFVQWAKAVNLLQDTPENASEAGDRRADDDSDNQDLLDGKDQKNVISPRLNQALASELMVQLEQLLNVKTLRERYKLELIASPSNSTASDTLTSTTALEGGKSVAPAVVLQKLVPDTVRQHILARAKLIQHKNHLPQRLWWAGVDRKNFERMVFDVRALVTGLWALLDPIQREDSSAVMLDVLAKVVQISQDVGELKALQLQPRSGTEGADDILSVAADIKAARVEINDSEPGSMSMEGSTLPVELPKINRGLLTTVSNASPTAATSCALYNNKPVWLEYKYVGRKMKGKLVSRVKNLAFLLAKPKSQSFYTLQCIGFLEEEERFVFVYNFPAIRESPKSSPAKESVLQSTTASEGGIRLLTTMKHKDQNQKALLSPPSPRSLHDLIRENKAMKSPSVTTRLAIARQLCKTVLTLHTAGWLHKDLRSENVLFFENNATGIEPYVTGFSFSRQDSPTEISEQPSSQPEADIYRHPHTLGEPSDSFQKHMDLYSLGTILVELAEWKILRHIVKDCVDVKKGARASGIPLAEIAKVPQWLLDHELNNGQIKYRMSDAFADAVHMCVKFGLTDEGAVPDTLSDLLDMVRKLDGCRI